MDSEENFNGSSVLLRSNIGEAVNDTLVGDTAQMTVTKLLTDFPNIFLTCLGPVVAVISLWLNGCVLSAVVKVSQKELKSKYLLVNALVIDVLFPFSYTLATVLYIAKAFGLPSNYHRACLDGVVALFSPATQYAQAMSSLVLVLDRLYAIVLPLHYHINAYMNASTFGILSGLWIISLGLVVPVLVFAKRSTGDRGLCLGLAEQHRDWNNTVRFPIVISISGTVFLIYVILYVITKWRKGPIKTRNKSHKVSTKESVSLAMTFFAVHLSALFLYIPGPLFAMLVRAGFVPLSNVSMWKIRRTLILLYLCNSLVDPIIMATRIPAIKLRLLRYWNSTPQHQANSFTASEDISREIQDIVSA